MCSAKCAHRDRRAAAMVSNRPSPYCRPRSSAAMAPAVDTVDQPAPHQPVAPERAQQAARLRAGLLEFRRRMRSRPRCRRRCGTRVAPPATVIVRIRMLRSSVPSTPQVAHRAGVRVRAARASSSASSCMQRIFGQPVIVPPGNTAAIASPGVTSVAQLAAHVRHDVVHVRIALDRHELVDAHGARPADRGRDRCAPGRPASRARPAPSR